MIDELIPRSEFRHYCRHPRCRTKLREPEPNHHRAFCSRGCHEGFYSRRCLVCDRELPPGRSDRKICKRSKCRSAYRQNPQKYAFGYSTSDSAQIAQKAPDSSGCFWRDRDGRGWRFETIGSEHRLYDRDDCLAVVIREDDGRFILTQPRAIPEQSTASLDEAIQLAKRVALWTRLLDQKYAAHLHRQNVEPLKHYFAELSKRTIFRPHTAPLNVLGGYHFPDGPTVDPRGRPEEVAEIRHSDCHPVLPAELIGNDLSIPGFLRRTDCPPEKKKAA